MSLKYTKTSLKSTNEVSKIHPVVRVPIPFIIPKIELLGIYSIRFLEKEKFIMKTEERESENRIL